MHFIFGEKEIEYVTSAEHVPPFLFVEDDDGGEDTFFCL